MYSWHFFWHGTNGLSFQNLIAHDWIIPMIVMLVAYCLLPMRGRFRVLFWATASFAVMVYAVWLATYIGIPPPQL